MIIHVTRVADAKPTQDFEIETEFPQFTTRTKIATPTKPSTWVALEQR